MTKGLLFVAVVALLSAAANAVARAADVVPPASQRFSDPASEESPDFQRHVSPLLSRLGCNGRACHGSFQGRGGFRLSLFGYDFDADHTALIRATGDEGRPRVDRDDSGASLILQKPTLQLEHEGGQRLERQSWQYRLLSLWIESGASRGTTRELVELEAQPAELVLARPGDAADLRIIARWADGTQEDVTCLCRFQTNDDALASVSADGRVQALGTGDSHIVAFYDNGVLAVPVLVPVSERVGERYPPVATPTRIDELVVGKLRKLGIVPSEVCTDAEFLRRASLDITGTLPTPAEVEAFLADASSDKRKRLIDELVDRPAYAAWWANKFCDFTGCSPNQQSEAGQQLSVQWYMWIYARLRENVPYDELVSRIVLATSRRPGQSYDDYAAEMSSYLREVDPADFAARETMPHYWTRRSLAKPEDKAQAFAHSFLGIRLQCAECHKHPYDRWTQQDFRQFSSLFAGIKYGVPPESQSAFQQLAQATGGKANQNSGVNGELLAMAEEGKTIPWRELFVSSGGGQVARILQHEVDPADRGTEPRETLMTWLRRSDNPYFARVLVNRVWAGYFHRGIIEPTDDLNPANPAANEEVLDYLARGLVKHDYDLKWLHREIAASNTYQRSWRPNDTNRLDRRNFSRQIPRRLPAEVFYDALKQVAAADGQFDEVQSDLSRRAIGHLSMRMAGTYAMHVFGKPERATNCDCERTSTLSLLQAIFVQNDPLIHLRLAEEGWLADVAAAKEFDADGAIRAAYLRTLSRPPTADEIARAKLHLEQSPSPAAGLRDLVWALVNTKEFLLNH